MAQQKGIRLSGAFDREQRLAKTTTLEGSAAPLTRVLRCDAAVSRLEEKWLDGRLIITGEVLLPPTAPTRTAAGRPPNAPSPLN